MPLPQIIKQCSSGYNYGRLRVEILHFYIPDPKQPWKKGTYRNITGMWLPAWGYGSSEKNRDVRFYLGSYPITPATEIIMSVKHKSLGVKSFSRQKMKLLVYLCYRSSYTVLWRSHHLRPGLTQK